MKSWVNISLLCISIYVVAAERNNVCKTFGEYSVRDLSANCWYNPDVAASASDLILRHGYPLEIYEGITEDSYILQVFRIPPKSNNNKGIVFLQHPLTASCSIWIDLGNQSLAFLLADAGYDVWLGNFRGTIYSNKHVYLSPESNKYWNFTFHEYGFYDIPAQLDVVKRETGNNKPFYYIGHSAATSAAYVYSSLRPQHAKENIKLFISMSPIASLRDLKSPATIIAPFTDALLFLAEALHVLNIVPYHGIVHSLLEILCYNIPLPCAELVMLCFGSDWKYADPSLYPILISQVFAGFSVKVVAHYGQIYNARGRFQWFDYGTRKNMYYYHSKRPPLYPIENITVPMFFLYGGHDALATEKDVLRFYNKLPPVVRYGIKNVQPYNHVDFVYSKEVVDFVYNPIIKLIEEMGQK